MARPTSAHELADWARCPRAWWYDRNDPRAALSGEELRRLLESRQVGPGRRGGRDPEVELLHGLLARRARFERGVRAHQADAARVIAHPARLSLPLPLLAAASLILLLVAALLWL